MANVKLFIMADSEEDFDRACEYHLAQEYSPELLTDITQVRDYNNVEVWDIRKLSVALLEEEIDPLIM